MLCFAFQYVCYFKEKSISNVTHNHERGLNERKNSTRKIFLKTRSFLLHENNKMLLKLSELCCKKVLLVSWPCVHARTLGDRITASAFPNPGKFHAKKPVFSLRISPRDQDQGSSYKEHFQLYFASVH